MREEALATLSLLVAQRPGLGARSLMAAMKGKRMPLTAEQLRDLLSGDRFRTDGHGWYLVGRPPTQIPSGPEPLGRPPASGLSEPQQHQGPAGSLPGAAASLWQPADLYVVLGTNAPGLLRAMRILFHDGTEKEHWEPKFRAARDEQPMSLTPTDLREIQGALLVNPAGVGRVMPDASRPAMGSAVAPLKDAARTQAQEDIEDAAQFAPGWEKGVGGCYVYRCAPPTTLGEKVLDQKLSTLRNGLVVLHPILLLRQGVREVDAVVVTRDGVVVIEQKDVPQGSALLTMGPNSTPVLDEREHKTLSGVWRQARGNSQKLASLLQQKPSIDAGFVHGVISVHGVARIKTTNDQLLAVPTNEVVTAVLSSLSKSRVQLYMRDVASIVDRLDLHDLSDADMAEAGFPTE